jgi:circadian clock protein KaiB
MKPRENNGMKNRDDVVTFRLYVAGRAPNSLRALANLEMICQEYLTDHYQIEVVNILEYPMRALADDVLLTPTLVKVSPPPGWQIVGSLSDHSAVLIALGIKEDLR